MLLSLYSDQKSCRSFSGEKVSLYSKLASYENGLHISDSHVSAVFVREAQNVPFKLPVAPIFSFPGAHIMASKYLYNIEYMAFLLKYHGVSQDMNPRI